MKKILTTTLIFLTITVNSFADVAVLSQGKLDKAIFTRYTSIHRVTNPDLAAWNGSVPWTDYTSTSTVTGWSSFTNKQIYYKVIGKECIVTYIIDGTSDQTYARFTVPYTSSNTINTYTGGYAKDNGTASAGGGLVVINQNSNLVTLYKDMTAAAFTASGVKNVRGQFRYDIP